ncbi:MAG TPA: hypothetical protein VMA34_14190 [Terracidiphilus sp.]|nr:hypothetical protein [Terracidiphilus sp.]
MNLYILQLQYILQPRCNPSKRENRQNGNEESSQEGTREESRQEGGEEEVTGNQPKRQHSRGTLQSAPSVFLRENTERNEGAEP